MRTTAAAVLTLLVCFSLFALPPVGGDNEAGAAIFKKRCATCHAQDGSGNEKMAKMLKVELAINTDAVAAMSDEDIGKLLAEGRGKKKPVKGLSDDDVANVIAFVRTLKK